MHTCALFVPRAYDSELPSSARSNLFNGDRLRQYIVLLIWRYCMNL